MKYWSTLGKRKNVLEKSKKILLFFFLTTNFYV